jgi:hypothetical protein
MGQRCPLTGQSLANYGGCIKDGETPTGTTEEPAVNATARKLIARTRAAIQTAVRICRAARYTALNGPLGDQLANGQLIQASTYLRTLGLEEWAVRSTRSHFGKKVKAAHLAATGTAPLMAWVMVDDRWMRVCVYAPQDPALAAAVDAYPRLANIVRDAQPIPA